MTTSPFTKEQAAVGASTEPVRCASLAAARDEPMAGSAPTVSRFLLIERPGAWGADALKQSGLADATAAELTRRAAQSEIRILVVRRPGRSRPNAALHWGVVDTAHSTAGVRWGEYAGEQELLDLPFDEPVASWQGTVISEPIYLVCVHSKRDLCCSLMGRPLAHTLAGLRPGTVWESSHLGGHRFAANVLALPSGELFGRLSANDAHELVDAVEHRRVLLGRQRGRSGLGRAAQIAKAYVHEQLGIAESASVVVSAAEMGRNDAERIIVKVPGGTVQVHLTERMILSRGSCRDLGDRTEVSLHATAMEWIDP